MTVELKVKTAIDDNTSAEEVAAKIRKAAAASVDTIESTTVTHWQINSGKTFRGMLG